MEAIAEVNGKWNKYGNCCCIINETGNDGNRKQKDENSKPLVVATPLRQEVCKNLQKTGFYQSSAHDKYSPNGHYRRIAESTDGFLPGKNVKQEQNTDSAHGSNFNG